MACKFCDVPLYAKVIRYSAPLLAPMTRAEELRQELENITGEFYARIDNEFCPMCGKKKERNKK